MHELLYQVDLTTLIRFAIRFAIRF